MSRLVVRQAWRGELPVISGLIRESARWMHSRGWDAWPPDGLPDYRLTPGIAAGTVWLLWDGPTPIATFALDRDLDPEFTAAGYRPGAALNLHRMAVTRERAGKGIGPLVLDWVTDRTARAELPYVWANINRRAVPLQNWYARHGFNHMGTVTSTGRKSGSLWCRPAERQPQVWEQIREE